MAVENSKKAAPEIGAIGSTGEHKGELIKQENNYMHDWSAGEPAKITNLRSAYYGQIGIVESEGARGGLYIKHEDGNTVYHPWGYDIVRDRTMSNAPG